MNPWPIAIGLAVLVVVGWAIGGAGVPPGIDSISASPASAVLNRLGLGPVRFECIVTSSPNIGTVSVDGKRLGVQTPAIIPLTPGTHRIAVTAGEWGSATKILTGRRGERLSWEADLSGSIELRTPRKSGPIAVAVDGVPAGTAPSVIQGVAPGPHEVSFSNGDGVPLVRAISVPVNRRVRLTLPDLTEPALGIVAVSASIVSDDGADEVGRLDVWIDKDRRVVAPLTLTLPRGPHSFRARYRGEDAPVQLVDLPGGNKRFIRFEFGHAVERPGLVLLATSGAKRGAPPSISVKLTGVDKRDVSEMWLHWNSGGGAWRRSPMTMLSASGGAVGFAVLPQGAPRTSYRYYVSVLAKAGDEYFTEIDAAAPAKLATR